MTNSDMRNRWLWRLGCEQAEWQGGYHAMTGPLPAGHNGAVDNGLIRAVYNEHGQAALAYATKLTGDRTVGRGRLARDLGVWVAPPGGAG